MTLKYKNIISIKQNIKKKLIFSRIKINNFNLNYTFFLNYILKLNKPVLFISNVHFFKKINNTKNYLYLH